MVFIAIVLNEFRYFNLSIFLKTMFFQSEQWKSVKRLGATVVLVGDAYDEAQAYAKARAEAEGRTFIPPFDHPDVIIGQGTVGMEINRQLKENIHAVFVPVGGGGLIAGIAAYLKRVAPDIKIIGVEPLDANAMALSLQHGQRVMLDQVGGFADGVAVKVVGEETYRLCKELIDGVVLVGRDAICASIKVSLHLLFYMLLHLDYVTVLVFTLYLTKDQIFQCLLLCSLNHHQSP